MILWATRAAVALITLLPVRIGAQAQPDDLELASGIRQAQAGDFAAAIVTLDAAARRLAADGGRPTELARAYAYLAVCYIGLNHIETAKAKFLDAWKADQDFSMDTTEFAPGIVKLFEQTRQEAQREMGTGPPAPAASSMQAAVPEPRKGGKALLIVGGAAAAAGVAVAAAGGGTSGSAAATPSTPPTTMASPLAVTLLGTDPQPGSRVSISQGPGLTLSFSVVSTVDLEGTLYGAVPTLAGGCFVAPGDAGYPAFNSTNRGMQFVRLTAGRAQVVSMAYCWTCQLAWTCGSLPATMSAIQPVFYVQNGAPVLAPSIPLNFTLEP
jgi:hypothetical protein